MIQFLQALLDGLSLGSMYAVLAVGVAVVGAVMSFPNFAHGWQVMWVAALTVMLGAAMPTGFALILASLVVIGLSVVAGRLVLLWGAATNGEILMLKSLALGLVLQSIGVIVFGDGPRLYPTPGWMGSVFDIAGLRIGASSVASLALSGVSVTSLVLLLRRTDLGLMMRAVSQSESTAALVGIHIQRVVTIALVLAGAMAAIAAFLWYAKAGNVTARSGMEITMTAFVALVIGGLRNVGGSIVGGLALGIVTALLATYLPVEFQGFTRGATYALLIGILILRPDGLVQRKR